MTIVDHSLTTTLDISSGPKKGFLGDISNVKEAPQLEFRGVMPALSKSRHVQPSSSEFRCLTVVLCPLINSNAVLV